MLSSELPKEYSPFKELEICSNQFIDGKIPIEVHKNAIFLIGRGPHPLIWLSGLFSKEGKQFQEIVKKNKSLNEAVKVNVSAKGNSTVVKVGDIIILEVTKVSEEKAIVSKIDLRPVGFNIQGNANQLTVGTNSFISNTFSHVRTMIGIGK